MGYKLLQVVKISCNNVDLYSPCSSGISEPFSGKGKLSNETDGWNSFFHWASCSVKLEEEEEGAAQPIPSCSGPVPPCGGSTGMELDFAKLLSSCGTAIAGAYRLSLGWQRAICLGFSPYTLALPCACQW